MTRLDDLIAVIDDALRESMDVQIAAMSHLPPDWGDNAAELLAKAKEGLK